MVDLYFDPVSSRTFEAAFQFTTAQTMISRLFNLYNFIRICQLVAEGNYATLRTAIRSYNKLTVVCGVRAAPGIPER